MNSFIVPLSLHDVTAHWRNLWSTLQIKRQCHFPGAVKIGWKIWGRKHQFSRHPLRVWSDVHLVHWSVSCRDRLVCSVFLKIMWCNHWSVAAHPLSVSTYTFLGPCQGLSFLCVGILAPFPLCAITGNEPKQMSSVLLSISQYCGLRKSSFTIFTNETLPLLDREAEGLEVLFCLLY